MRRRPWPGTLWAAWIILSVVILLFYDSPTWHGWLVVLLTSLAATDFGPPWPIFRARGRQEHGDEKNAVEGPPPD